MTVQDELSATRSAVVELERRVRRLREQYGDTLGMQRLLSDVSRFSADLAELGEPTPALRRQQPSVHDVLRIEDREYDPSFWSGVDDEGLGAADRHAP